MIFFVKMIDDMIVNEIYQWILVVEYYCGMIIFVSLLSNDVDSLCPLFLILIDAFSSFKHSIHLNDTILMILIIINLLFGLDVMFLTSIFFIILNFICAFAMCFHIVKKEDLFIWILIKIFEYVEDS